MELYWLLRLPQFHQIFISIAEISLLFSILSIVLLILGSFPDPKNSWNCDFRAWRPYKNFCFWLLGISISCFMIAAFIPSKTDLAIMMGWDALGSKNVEEVIQVLKEKLK